MPENPTVHPFALISFGQGHQLSYMSRQALERGREAGRPVIAKVLFGFSSEIRTAVHCPIPAVDYAEE
jgi:hypothetical protein